MLLRLAYRMPKETEEEQAEKGKVREAALKKEAEATGDMKFLAFLTGGHK